VQSVFHLSVAEFSRIPGQRPQEFLRILPQASEKHAEQKLCQEIFMPDGPFSGLVVLDVTRVLAGPFCTMMLAELGARVIKVEDPRCGDDARQFEPFSAGQSTYFASLNRGKESIALNLKHEADREVFWQLVRRADVLVENFRPGTLERLGLGYDKLRAENPRLIYGAVSGFGQTGPWSRKPAYDLIVQALGGMMSVTGQPGGPPTKAGTSIGDITGGLFLLAGIAAALYRREKTGQGDIVDVAMLDGQIAILESAVMRYAATQQTPGPMGNRHPSIAPFEPYDTADRPVVIAAGNDVLFAKLCSALDRPELATDPRFATNRERVAHSDELKAVLEAILRTKAAAHWIGVLEAAGVPCALVQNVAEAVNHPQTRARNMIVRGGDIQMAGNPIKFGGSVDTLTRRPAPELDADGPRIRREGDSVGRAGHSEVAEPKNE
jgi:CoA:oxalate CoA-transferase